MTDADGAIYVYGVIAGSDRTDIESAGVGSSDTPVRRVAYDGVAALVSDIPRGPLAAARDLRAHWRVLEEAAAETTVLPVQFGTVMESEEAVRDSLLAPNAERLEALLDALADKVQLTVKGFYDEEQLLREIVNEAPAVARMRERTQRLPEAASYYDRIRLGELVSAEVDRRRARDAELVLGRLEPLAAAAKAEPVTGKDGAFAAAFLVPRQGIDDFSRAVKGLADELSDRIRIRYVGPLPPYSFADDEAVGAGTWA